MQGQPYVVARCFDVDCVFAYGVGSGSVQSVVLNRTSRGGMTHGSSPTNEVGSFQ